MFPAAPAIVANSPVLRVEGRHARRSQSLAEVSGMRQVVLRPPIASVHVQQNRIGPLPFRQPRFEELVGVGAIRHPAVGLRPRLA